MNKKAAEALPRPLFYLILIGIFKKNIYICNINLTI